MLNAFHITEAFHLTEVGNSVDNAEQGVASVWERGEEARGGRTFGCLRLRVRIVFRSFPDFSFVPRRNRSRLAAFFVAVLWPRNIGGDGMLRVAASRVGPSSPPAGRRFKSPAVL